MQTEDSISRDLEKPDDEREFQRLIRAVKFSQKYFLYFVCCNQVPRQNELIADVKKTLDEEKIKVVRFKEPITDLLAEIEKKKFTQGCEAVFVQGLENSISSDAKGDENALIYNLNISRDTFKKYFSCPMFLWLPEYAIVKITRHAPDFFSVRSGIFYFSSPPEKVTEQIFQSFTSGWLETSSLSLAEKQKRIETLESLLAEYRGLHKEKQNKRTESRLLSELGDFFFSISSFQKAIKYNEQALAIYREIGDRQGESAYLGNLGLAYENLGEYRKAIEYHKQALEIAREIEDRRSESDDLGNLGIIYNRLGENQKAIEYYKQALEIAREIKHRYGESCYLGNLGIAYKNLGENQKAIEYHKQALEIAREIKHRYGESSHLGNLGNVYVSLGEYRKAIEYHHQGLEIARKLGYRLDEGNHLGNLGNVYRRLGENKKAVDYYQKAFEVAKEIEDYEGEGRHLGNLGIAYSNLGKKEKACELWKEALTILKKFEHPFAIQIQKRIEKDCG